MPTKPLPADKSTPPPEYLTKKEEELLQAIETQGTVRFAAVHLHISVKTAYNVLYRIRNKYRWARGYCNNIMNWRRKSRRLEQVLTKKIPMVDEEEI